MDDEARIGPEPGQPAAFADTELAPRLLDDEHTATIVDLTRSRPLAADTHLATEVFGSPSRSQHTRTLWSRVGAIGDRAGDSEQQALAHRFLVYMSLLMSGGGLAWSLLGTALGFFPESLIPFGYVVLTAVNLAYFRSTKNFERVRFVQVGASLLLPFLFQWSMGGFYASGVSMLWAMLAIVGAVTFTSATAVRKWLFLYSVLTILSGVVDATVEAKSGNAVPRSISTVFFVGNIVLISNIVFGLVMYFLHQREQHMKALAHANDKIGNLEEEIKEARRLGQYTLQRKLGEGGMGVVYAASHALLRRPTAVKLVHPEQAGRGGLARFEREVQQTARLTHPNTVTIFDYGRTPDGVFYYAMELLDGVTLAEVVRVSGPLPPGRVIRILHQVAGALSEAHEIGLIHRDIKPANIMLADQGGSPDQAKVLDFGLVKELEAKGDAAATREDNLAGTPQYMAPEALRAPESVTELIDIYSLGALGYFLSTGTHLFEGESPMEVCASQLYKQPQRPSERLGRPLPRDLEQLLLCCLEKDPSKRPQSAAEVRTLLSALADFRAWSEQDAWAWWAQYRELHSSEEPTEGSPGSDTELRIAIGRQRRGA